MSVTKVSSAMQDLTDDYAFSGTVSGAGAVGKNKIINGGFQVNQRTYVSTAATADGTYMHDRWRSGTADSSYTFSVAGPCSPQTVTIAANDSIEQVIEGNMINTAGTHTISWTGTATCRAVVNTQTMSGNFAVSPITVTAVLNQVITVQFTGANAAGGATIATNTGTLGKVQCELGSSATDFEEQPIGNVIALCQRYYEALTGVAWATMFSMDVTSGSTYYFTVPFKQAKRATPTMAYTNHASGQGFNTTVVGTQGVNTSGFTVSKAAISTTAAGYTSFYWTATAEL